MLIEMIENKLLPILEVGRNYKTKPGVRNLSPNKIIKILKIESARLQLQNVTYMYLCQPGDLQGEFRRPQWQIEEDVIW
jgi:hypothetical protein